MPGRALISLMMGPSVFLGSDDFHPCFLSDLAGLFASDRRDGKKRLPRWPKGKWSDFWRFMPRWRSKVGRDAFELCLG
jgi:hypothetical protein